MKIQFSPLPLLILFVLCSSSAVCSAKEFSFFYFVQQWVGSFNFAATGCCVREPSEAFDDHSAWATDGEAHPQFADRTLVEDQAQGFESSPRKHHRHHGHGQQPDSHSHSHSCSHLSRTPKADFGIHGLWPNYDSDDEYPQNCDAGNELDLSQISDLLDQLEENWQTLSCKNSDSKGFWDHEWSKHGTCSGFDQHGYFATGLALKQKTRLLSALNDAGIVPDGSSYSLESVKNAVSAVTGFEPKIHCSHKDGQTLLAEVYICVDTAGKEFIECPAHRDEGCRNEVVFPAFDAGML